MSNYKKNSFDYFKNKIILQELNDLRKIIKKNFNNTISYYNKLSINNFRKKVFNVKKKIVKSNLVNQMRKKVAEHLKVKLKIKDEIYTTSYFTLLVARPENQLNLNNDEVLEFHRESFYAGPDKKFIKKQINVWIPIFNLNKNQSLKYIPQSAKILDKKFKFEIIKSQNVKKKSLSHQLGYLHTTKRIIKGLDLSKAKRFDLPKNSSIIFDSNLIHGAGINMSKKIRFVIAFGLIEKNKYLKLRKKKIKSFRSNQEYYLSLDNLDKAA